ncbi:MAG: hypothetical protein JW913_05925, partial [Chitinispirillaceae bacterium]|nr:hypothetical protein [Chitinispirillaceae bacterium]
MKIGLRQWTALCGCALAAGLFCAPMSTDPSEGEATLLELSLEEPGRTSAEFSGAPIEALIELDRDTVFNALYWRTGKGDPPRCADTVFEKAAKKFAVQLFWTKYPLFRDSLDSSYYDTVWVSMGGGLKKSNKVRVKVTNLPVVVDSARFDSLFLLGQDTVWRCSLPPVMKASYRLYIYARDLDRKTVSLRINGNKGKIIRSDVTSLEMEYQPPEGDFIDTIR